MQLLNNRPFLLGLGLFFGLLADIFVGSVTPENAVRQHLSLLYASPSLSTQESSGIWVYQVHQSLTNPLAFEVLLDVEKAGAVHRVMYPVTLRQYRGLYLAPKLDVPAILALPSQSAVPLSSNKGAVAWRSWASWALAGGMTLGLVFCLVWMTLKSPCRWPERVMLVVGPPVAITLSLYAMLYAWLIPFPV